jgi:hypothetical protein
MSHSVIIEPKEIGMAKREQRGNREAKKPKKEKTIVAAPSQKTAQRLNFQCLQRAKSNQSRHHACGDD